MLQGRLTVGPDEPAPRGDDPPLPGGDPLYGGDDRTLRLESYGGNDGHGGTGRKTGLNLSGLGIGVAGVGGDLGYGNGWPSGIFGGGADVRNLLSPSSLRLTSASSSNWISRSRASRSAASFSISCSTIL